MKKTLIMILAVLVFASAGCSQKEAAPITENITREQEVTEEPAENIEESETDALDSTDKQEEPEVIEEKPLEPEKEEAEPAPVNLSTVNSEIKTAVSASDAMDLDAEGISNLYGILPEDIGQAAGFVVMDGTFPHEAVMVEAKDTAAAERIENLLKEKHTAFKEQSKGYDAQNYELASKCKVERNGNFISMFLTPDFETMRAIYSQYVK